jgi:hypothetical protein
MAEVGTGVSKNTMPLYFGFEFVAGVSDKYYIDTDVSEGLNASIFSSEVDGKFSKENKCLRFRSSEFQMFVR